MVPPYGKHQPSCDCLTLLLLHNAPLPPRVRDRMEGSPFHIPGCPPLLSVRVCARRRCTTCVSWWDTGMACWHFWGGTQCDGGGPVTEFTARCSARHSPEAVLLILFLEKLEEPLLCSWGCEDKGGAMCTPSQCSDQFLWDGPPKGKTLLWLSQAQVPKTFPNQPKQRAFPLPGG